MTTKKPTKWVTPGESLQPDVDIGEWNVLHLGTFATNVIRRNHRIVNAYRPHLKKPPEHLYPVQGTNIILIQRCFEFLEVTKCHGIQRRISPQPWRLKPPAPQWLRRGSYWRQGIKMGYDYGVPMAEKWSASSPVDCVDFLGFCLGECEQKIMPFFKGYLLYGLSR